MADKWIDKAQLAGNELAAGDLVMVGDVSEAVGSRNKVAALQALRSFLGAGVTVGVEQEAHGLSVGDVVRHDGDDYVQATADTAANAEAVGVVTTADTDTFTFQTAGLVTGLSGLTAGELYYLQDDGSLGTTADTVDKPVLIAVSSTAAVLILAISGEGAGGAAWGDITGTLSNQTDLATALNARLNKLATIHSESGNHTLDGDDSGAYVRITAAGTVTLPDGLSTGFQAVIVNATDSDTVALSAATTLTIPAGFEAEVQNRRAVTVIHVGSNVWEAHGALVESE